MKFMDKDGKLFGKLNVIDALVLVVLVAVIAVVGVKLAGGGTGNSADGGDQQSAGNENWICFTVRATSVDPMSYAVVEKFVNGEGNVYDPILSSNDGGVDGYVISAIATPHISYVATEDGRLLTVESTGDDKRLDVVLVCVANVDDFTYNKFSTQEIRAGRSYTLKTTHFEFTSTILSVEWTEGYEDLAQWADLDALSALRKSWVGA